MRWRVSEAGTERGRAHHGFVPAQPGPRPRATVAAARGTLRPRRPLSFTGPLWHPMPLALWIPHSQRLPSLDTAIYSSHIQPRRRCVGIHSTTRIQILGSRSAHTLTPHTWERKPHLGSAQEDDHTPSSLGLLHLDTRYIQVMVAQVLLGRAGPSAIFQAALLPTPTQQLRTLVHHIRIYAATIVDL